MLENAHKFNYTLVFKIRFYCCHVVKTTFKNSAPSTLHGSVDYLCYCWGLALKNTTTNITTKQSKNRSSRFVFCIICLSSFEFAAMHCPDSQTRFTTSLVLFLQLFNRREYRWWFGVTRSWIIPSAIVSRGSPLLSMVLRTVYNIHTWYLGTGYLLTNNQHSFQILVALSWEKLLRDRQRNNFKVNSAKWLLIETDDDPNRADDVTFSVDSPRKFAGMFQLL